MSSLGAHVLLICLVAGYFVIVESRNYVIKDSYNRNPDTIRKKKLYSYAEIAKWLKKHKNDEKLKRNKEKLNVIKALVAKIIKKERRKLHAKRNLRNGMEVQNFLHKLKHFINENTQHNNYYEKRFDCKFGFGNPSRVCKTQKFRRHSSKSKKGRNTKKHAYNYAQPMFVERADSSSSSSSSDETAAAKPKYRFQVVDNKRHKHKTKTREISESEEQSSEGYSEESDDNIPVKTKHTSYSDEASNGDDKKPIKTKQISYSDEDTSYEYKRKQNIKPGNEESAKASGASSMEGNDVKYLYLQGTRLQKPDFRSGRWKSGRRGDRLPSFMPKRHKWDSHLFHHLDTYWENIKAYDSYHKKYNPW